MDKHTENSSLRVASTPPHGKSEEEQPGSSRQLDRDRLRVLGAREAICQGTRLEEGLRLCAQARKTHVLKVL